MTALIGPSGCGKSTFLRSLNRMHEVLPGARVEGKVARIGKTLSAEVTDAESIGLVVMRGLGAPLFAKALEDVMRQPRGVSRWFLSAIDDLATRGVVGAASIAGLGWTEVDYPGDLGRAEMLARGWTHKERQQAAAASPYPLAQ